MAIDLNHGSGFIYGAPPAANSAGARLNALIDDAMAAANARQTPRDYLGGSRVGEPCARKLVFEYTHTPKDPGKEFDGRILRIFDAGHRFEDLSIEWIRAAGFDLRTRRKDGGQFGFSTAGGRIKGHIDGVIVSGPDIGVQWPALWEHKAINAKSWRHLLVHGLRASKPVYWGQVQLYMAYMQLSICLFTAMNKDTQELYHEVVALDVAQAQALSDKAVQVIQMAEAGELPPPISATSDFYLCRWCEYALRCRENLS